MLIPSAAGAPSLFVNETTARSLFAGETVVGRRVRLSNTTAPVQPWRTIAGVVADVRQRGLDRAPRPEMYVPHAQFQHFMLGAQAGLVSGDVGAGLALTGHFLEAFIFNPLNRPLPPARVWLLQRLADAGRL